MVREEDTIDCFRAKAVMSIYVLDNYTPYIFLLLRNFQNSGEFLFFPLCYNPYNPRKNVKKCQNYLTNLPSFWPSSIPLKPLHNPGLNLTKALLWFFYFSTWRCLVTSHFLQDQFQTSHLVFKIPPQLVSNVFPSYYKCPTI